MEDLRAKRKQSDPLRVYCRKCGAPAGFDIVKQSYRCAFCGAADGIPEVRADVAGWRRLERQNAALSLSSSVREEHACPACGAQVIFPEGEASESCDFCGGRLVRRSFAGKGELPEMVIPFVLTAEEAEKRLADWAKKHRRKAEARAVSDTLTQLKGYYLPYRFVRGPVEGEVSRTGTERKYRCRGFLEGTAVSTTEELDNSVLDAMEPFDWSETKPFSFGYIAGHKVKMPGISNKETLDRVEKETGEDFLPEVEKVMETRGVDLKVTAGEMEAVPVLLPVYFLKTADLTAVVNGQTGRISVSDGRKKKSVPGFIEPFLYALTLTLGVSAFYRFNPEAVLLFGSFFFIFFFAVMGDAIGPVTKLIIHRSKNAAARRQEGELIIEEGKDVLKNPFDNSPVFLEEKKGAGPVPAKIRFHSFGRALQILWNCFMTLFLPAVIAALIRLLEISESGEPFSAKYDFWSGAAWYVLAAFIVILYWAKGVRRDIYEHPIIYEIQPDGRLRKMGSARSRRVSVLSMFGIGIEKDEKGRTIGLLRFLRMLGKPGFFLGFTLLAILAGSVAAILN